MFVYIAGGYNNKYQIRMGKYTNILTVNAGSVIEFMSRFLGILNLNFPERLRISQFYDI